MGKVLTRPRLALLLGFVLYVLAGLTVTDVQSLQISAGPLAECQAPLLAELAVAGSDSSKTGAAPSLTVLQGNAWMLPVRPLLLPYAFSTDRKARLERLVETVRACRPDVVVLQEVFETAVADVIARRLPDYRLITSRETDLTGTVNASGLVTLTRLQVERVRFHPFASLPAGAKTIERLGRKGFLAVDVSGPGFRGSVVNLHLYASRDAVESRITRGQLAEVVAFVQAERRAGNRVLVAGDFNLTAEEVAAALPHPWAASHHGPTYDPPGNRYTVEGANNTPGNLEERRLGLGVKTVDFLFLPGADESAVRSGVLAHVPLSDHYFIEHVIVGSRP